jgi:hypothetical protein
MTSTNPHPPSGGVKRRRILPWLLGGVGALLLLAVAAVLAGGWWLEHRLLRGEIRFGADKANSVRVYGGELRWWALRFEADSAWYRSPNLDARADKVFLDADLLRGLTQFRPAARVAVDSVYLRLRADTLPDTTKPLDSLAWPDFNLPVAARAKVRVFVLEDDSGRMVHAESLQARTRGGKRVEARVGNARTRWTKTLALGATASADWSIRDSVAAEGEVRRGPDRIRLNLRHAKRPLWKGRDAVSAEIADSRPYARAFGGRDADSLPRLRNVRLQASARLARAPELDLSLRGGLAEYRLNPEFALSPQSVDLSVNWKDDRGDLRLRSRGLEGEDISLRAEGRRLPLPAGRDSAPLWERAAVSLRGHARGFRVLVQDTLRKADLVIDRADWNGRVLDARVRTGDSSVVEAKGSARSGDDWNAAFVLDANPGERWITVFLGRNVTFARFRAEGNVRGTPSGITAEAMASARKLTAWGVHVDSARTWHAYGPGGYVLKPSKLYDGKTVWEGSGRVVPPKRPGGRVSMEFNLAAQGKGSVRYAQTADGTLEVTAESFRVGEVPYALLDSLPLQDPVVDGIFRWNSLRKTGLADVAAKARYKKEDLEARVAGTWDAARMDLSLASVRLRGSELNVRARARMNGKQFWEIYKVMPGQYEYATVQTPGFDIAEVLKVFQEEPALSKGSVNGELTYGVDQGFKGKLVFESITPREPLVGDVVLKELSLEGEGDTLSILGRTTSETSKLLNMRLRVGVSALLEEEQRIRLEAVAGDDGKTRDSTLRLQAEATTRRFQSLTGTLTLKGKAVLPEKSGSVENIDVDMAFDVPVQDPLKGAVLTTRAFTAVYVLPDRARQTLTLDPAVRGGMLRVNNFLVRNDRGQSLRGNLEYALATQSLKAHVEGERFAAQWADDYLADVSNLSLDVSKNAQGLRIDGGFARASFLYADPPLRAEGTLTSVRAAYEKLTVAGGRNRREAPASLTFTGNISESLVRYRLKSFADLQKTFRRDNRRKSGPAVRLNVQVRTLGDNNRIDSDVLRLTWVGNLSVKGTHPYTLFNGRINAIDGGLGTDRQAYGIRNMEVKWLNAPVGEGQIHMEAVKELVADCNRRTEANPDSCTVIARLDGKLESMMFSYDSDCGGSFGAGASVAAILYSVQRGCYDAALATGGDGSGYGERAITLFEPTLNRSLTSVVGRYTGNWIEMTEITGLSSLSSESPGGDTLNEAVSLTLTSKEFWRLRLKLRSGYHPASPDLANPMESMAALEWRPPADRLVSDERWKQRLRDNLRAAVSIQTRPVRRSNPEEDEIEKKASVNYNYPFWGEWWSKPRKREEPADPVAPRAQTTEGSK